ncbi:MAG: beta-lactamase family protein [Actinomycetota bacterium]|nr:beta-lactamase family protein [Actinomycetota bacterium]
MAQDAVSRASSRGFQAYVSLEETPVCNVAWGRDGLGARLTPEHLTAIHCAGKPIIAVAIGQLVAAGGVRWDSPIGEFVVGIRSPVLARTHLSDLLTHRAGLFRVTARSMHLLSEPDQRDYVLRTEPRGRPGDHAIYDEYASWHLLGEATTAISGMSLREYVRANVLEPVGVADDVFLGFDPDQLATAHRRIAANGFILEDRFLPRLLELTDRVLTMTQAAGGAYATVAGLGRFYDHLGGLLRGQAGGVLPLPTLKQMLRTRSPVEWDPGMRRRCSYSLGFMVDLTDHLFGSGLSSDAFGHSGDRGTTFAFHDPANGLTMAIQHIGIIDPERSILHRRELIVEALLNELPVGQRTSSIS